MPTGAPTERDDGLVVEALHNSLFGPVSFRLPAGGLLAVRGPSGCGKSVMLRAIADLDAAAGRIALGSVPRERIPAPLWRRQVALVPAESGWWADRVGAHFAAATLAAAPRDALIAEAGLPADILSWPVARLSSGERCRLALVRALAHEPEMLLLDEPTSALDPDSTAAVERLLQDRCAEGLGVLLVTHDPGQPARLAAPVLTMPGAGEIATVGSTA